MITLRVCSISRALQGFVLIFLCLPPAMVYAAPSNKISLSTEKQPLEVISRPPSVVNDPRFHYFYQLLKLALSETRTTDGGFVIKEAPFKISQQRAIALVKKGQFINILWTMTTPSVERTLKAIRIPLLRGLLGYRVLVIKANRANQFSNIDSLSGLSRLMAVQGTGWPDVTILRANGLKVVTAPVYKGLFRMVEAGHVDYLLRSVAEAGVELRSLGVHGLIVDPKIVLHYVAPIYFFVKKDNTALAARLRRGLKKAIKDGSFEKLFRKEEATKLALDWLERGKHKIFQLKNPILPKDTPINNTAYWYQYP